MRFLSLFALVLSVTALPISAKAQHPPTITEIVVASGGEFDRDRRDFDILLNAVLAAGLEGVLNDPEADFTVFAPNDLAFVRLAREFGYVSGGEGAAFGAIVAGLTELGDGDPIPLLQSVLLYHVSPGGKTLEDISHIPIIPTALEGASLVSVRLRLLDDEPDIRDPRIQEEGADIVASNGIIHTINRVLIPVDLDNTDNASLPTIAGVVAASGGAFDDNPDDFDLLLTALTLTDLAGALDNPGDSFTVFAPNDRAFVRTARKLGYHVAPEAQPVKSVLTSPEIATLQGGTITPNAAHRSLIDNDPNVYDPRVWITRSDIRTSNGFIHGINAVLIPVDLSTL